MKVPEGITIGQAKEIADGVYSDLSEKLGLTDEEVAFTVALMYENVDQDNLPEWMKE